MTDHYSASDLKTAGKLFILKQYLHPYLNIIHDHFDHVVYVDTHAGTGKSKVLDGDVTLRGSALLALDEDTKGGFDQYVFFEKDSGRVEKLAETIENEYGYSMEFNVLSVGNDTFTTATSKNPDIRILQLDSNAGVKVLAKLSNEFHHWFTFVDPERLRDLTNDTVDSLIARGGMDILLNFHTTGVKRAVASDHSTPAAEQYTGIPNLPDDQSLEEYADDYCDRLQTAHAEWEANHKPLEDPHNSSYQFDMVFASSNDTAHNIVQGIWNDDEFWPRVRNYMEGQRDDDDPQQSGFEDFS